MRVVPGIKKPNPEITAHKSGDVMEVISHEIYTSIAGITGMAELLLDSRLTCKQRQQAQNVLESADSLLMIVRDVLDFAKIEEGRLKLDPVPFDLRYLADEVAESMAPAAWKKSIELIVRFVPGTPQYLMGDPVRIRQILANLLSNAIKYTESGFVLVTVGEDKDSAMAEAHHKIKISVKDTGIGIAGDLQKNIFEKFSCGFSHRHGTRPAYQLRGTGLGLAICRSLCSMMGGEISVTSKPGAGSDFNFTMILEEDLAARDKSGLPDLSDLEGVKVLVADDIPINGTLLKENLERFGMRPFVCADGVQVLKELGKAWSADDPFEMAVLDCTMPGISGLDLAREITNNEKFQSTALTALVEARKSVHFKDYFEAGFTTILSKPVRVCELVETLAQSRDICRGGEEGVVALADPYLFGANKAGEAGTIQLKNTRILLAEDNRTSQNFAVEILEGANCHVDIAETGKEAIVLAQKNPYDLIFMDCEMPHVDGFEATRTLREMKKDDLLPDVPIVALTANAMEGDRERCLEAGMADYLPKPVRKKDLLGVLSRHLSGKVDLSATQMAEARFDGRHILLAEDNRTNRLMAQEMLCEIGFKVDVAANGQDALKMIQKNQKYDMVLMDVQMPVMDGFEATKKIRELIDQEKTEKLPIVALTANAMEGDRERCLEAGMADYLPKPLKRAALIAVILKFLKPCAQSDTDEDEESPILDTEILENYRKIMGEKFKLGVEGFLHDAQTLIGQVRQAWDLEDIKAVKIAAHSLKSSSAMLGAMELSRLSEILEEDARDLMENDKPLNHLSFRAVMEMEKALKRAVTFYRRYLELGLGQEKVQPVSGDKN